MFNLFQKLNEKEKEQRIKKSIEQFSNSLLSLIQIYHHYQPDDPITQIKMQDANDIHFIFPINQPTCIYSPSYAHDNNYCVYSGANQIDLFEILITVSNDFSFMKIDEEYTSYKHAYRFGNSIRGTNYCVEMATYYIELLHEQFIDTFVRSIDRIQRLHTRHADPALVQLQLDKLTYILNLVGQNVWDAYIAQAKAEDEIEKFVIESDETYELDIETYMKSRQPALLKLAQNQNHSIS